MILLQIFTRTNSLPHYILDVNNELGENYPALFKQSESSNGTRYTVIWCELEDLSTLLTHVEQSSFSSLDLSKNSLNSAKRIILNNYDSLTKEPFFLSELRALCNLPMKKLLLSQSQIQGLFNTILAL